MLTVGDALVIFGVVSLAASLAVHPAVGFALGVGVGFCLVCSWAFHKVLDAWDAITEPLRPHLAPYRRAYVDACRVVGGIVLLVWAGALAGAIAGWW